MVFGDQVCTYSQLTRMVDDWLVALAWYGIGPGHVVALEGPYSPHATAALLALIVRDAIVVPLAAALPAAKHAEFLDIAQVESVVRVDEWGTRSCLHTGWTASHPLYDMLRSDNAAGLVLFSSGTSGRCKASVLDFDRVLDRYRIPGRPRRTLAFLSLDHIGGINTLLHTLSNGGAVVTVGERSPDAVFAAIGRHRVQVLPTTPTFLNMVLISGAHQRHETADLALITYGTEPMPARTLQRLTEELPHVRFKQTYGLSELGIVPTKSKEDNSLWFRLGGSGFDHKIVDGILWVRSDMAMLGYLNAPSDFDADGYFNTQDAVAVDGDYVRVLGRRSEIINVGGEKVYPSEIESVLLQVPNIADATVSGRPNPVTGMVVTATVRLVCHEDSDEVSRRVRRYCAARLEAFKVPVTIEVSTRPQHSDRFKKVRSSR